ncbi:MAG TPA: OmcA/MtrC family decaheme c-type cytochrome [Bryobacteraceae bacterium]|nr:OmcA/MtrC family decaheme c-type cytochrome [Bryobacteraceae bacterium]
MRSSVAQAAVEYVNPGLAFTVVSAKIASDGTVSVDYKITDGTGLPLDLNGILTPGVVSPKFLAAYIPVGQEEYASYITTTATAVTGGATGTQASGDSGGSTSVVATGEYVYTFGKKAASGYNSNLTNRIGIYGSRNLTQWDMGTAYASTTFDFVPAGGTAKPRDVVRDADCNTCHSTLSFHGGSRVGVALCIMCHQSQTVDPNTGESLDMKVFIHKIHMGSSLPSVKYGAQPYQIYGHGGYASFSTVVYPANPGDPRNCAGSCHNPKNGAAQTNAWLTTPSRAACGSCHDDVNFATGAISYTAGGNTNTSHLPQIDDSQCSQCHIPQGELPFDASILGAHATLDTAPGVPGLNFTLTSVTGAAPGKAPTVNFTVKDNSGAGVLMSTFQKNSGSLSLTMAGPTSDFGYTDFGANATTPGYVTESVITGAQCDGSGNCSYTFTHKIPATAKGSYTIGIEGRMSVTLLPGTTRAMTTSYAGTNQVINFSVDGSPVTARRTVVAMANCNQCHTYLEIHGSLRNNVTYCVLCHNPSNTDATTRAVASNATQKAAPAQAINFAYMIHSIHTGNKLGAAGTDYVLVGFGGSTNDFGQSFAPVPAGIPNTGVLYPAMLNGSVGDTANCNMCHTGGSQNVLPVGKNAVTNPSALINPVPATTSACTACHFDTPTLAHAVLNTSTLFGESCTVCHGAGAAFDATAVHAGQ